MFPGGLALLGEGRHALRPIVEGESGVEGPTLEAHAFSDAAADFKKLGARVIGMSRDDLPTLERFSVEACRNAFPVATASAATVKAYDVAWAEHPELNTRTSYVIDRTGRIVMVHDDLDFSQHVARTLAAVRALRSKGR